MVNTFFLFCGCVDQASVAVVEKWGRFLRLADPGLHFFNPLAGECVAGSLTTRVQSLDVRVETKTKVRLRAPSPLPRSIRLTFLGRA
jgi:regulator of protease activity HflC (stomatin/prohibitin superfamily)